MKKYKLGVNFKFVSKQVEPYKTGVVINKNDIILVAIY